MVLRLYEFIFVLSVVIPGLMYIYFGRRRWKNDWVAMRTRVLVSPYLVFLLLLTLAAFFYESNGGPAGNLPPAPPYSFSSSLDGITWILLLPFALYLYYMITMGQILIFGARRDVVRRAIEEILDNRGLRYKLDWDVFVIPSIMMMIKMNWFDTYDLVGIFSRTWNWKWKAAIDRDIMATFKGLPSERTHPALMIFGTILVGIGIALGVAFAID